MNNYKLGALKRKLDIKGEFKPGEMISKMNAQKRSNIKNNNKIPKVQKIAIMGLV